MNITVSELDTLAATCQQVNGALLDATCKLAAGQFQNAQGAIGEAQSQNNRLRHQLEALGAVTLSETIQRSLPEEFQTEVPLHLLSSEKAQRYAQALRSVAVACREMEIERGIRPEDGLTEMFEDYADLAEQEVFGPACLRE